MPNEAEALLAKYDRPVPRYTSYPTAPQFHAGVDADIYGHWLESLDSAVGLSLYLHVPFCDSLCWFCGCHTKLVRRYEPIAAYVEALLAEIDLVADRFAVRPPVRHIHWGGGSPTMLAPDDLRRLVARLNRRFRVEPIAEHAFEIDPRGLGDETVAALAEIGVNRASLGVQDMDSRVQTAINRLQPYEITRDCIARLRAAGIGAINCDLMYGLPHQTTARVVASVEAVLGLDPDRLALFGYAHLPRMKRHQRLIREAALPGGCDRLEQAQAADARLRAAGYRRIGLDHFAHPRDPLAKAAESGRLHRNFQGYTADPAEVLLGLGASAIGRLPQGYVQNAVPIKAYKTTVLEGRLATARGLAFEGDDRLRSAVIERLMCDLEVDLAAVSADFCETPERFAPELAALAPLSADGLVEIAGFHVRVTENGRPYMRHAAAAFDRYFDGGTDRHARAV